MLARRSCLLLGRLILLLLRWRTRCIMHWGWERLLLLMPLRWPRNGMTEGGVVVGWRGSVVEGEPRQLWRLLSVRVVGPYRARRPRGDCGGARDVRRGG